MSMSGVRYALLILLLSTHIISLWILKLNYYYSGI